MKDKLENSENEENEEIIKLLFQTLTTEETEDLQEWFRNETGAELFPPQDEAIIKVNNLPDNLNDEYEFGLHDFTESYSDFVFNYGRLPIR